MLITFKEHYISGYKARTYENAKADATIAIATDFRTPGEICTKNAVKSQGKIYESVMLNNLTKDKALWIGGSILSCKTINIAGNGIYTLIKQGISQEKLDQMIYDFLNSVFYYSNKPLTLYSGGQTGIDEAGLKAAVKLNIPAICIAPKGWLFRDINGKDIADEKLFKARFDT